MRFRSVIVGGFLGVVAVALPWSASAQTLSVSPTTLSVQASPGNPVASQTVTVGKSGKGSLRWSVANVASWVTVSPQSGTNSGTLTVAFNTAPSVMPTSSGTSPAFTLTAANSSPVTVNVNLTILSSAPPPPSDWTFCASEGAFCTFAGTKEVRYGANGTYAYRTLADGTPCTNTAFGDPLSGVVKQCHFRASTASPTLTGVSISGPSSATVGQTAQYRTVAAYSDGSSQSVTSGPTWSTSNSGLATINAAGVLTAVATGTLTVGATYGGRTASPLAVSVAAAPAPPTGTVFYVSPSGLDSNPGTQSSPVRTIQRGVTLANQANGANDVTVSIAAGTYREQVQIVTLNTTKALTLQGAGITTVLTGADDWSAGWSAQPDGSYTHAWPYQWGMKPIPNGWDGYWNWDGNGYKRDVLRRSETVYVNGLPLRGVLTLAELSAAGTFYVNQATGTLSMRLPAGVGLAGSLVEVGIRQTPLTIAGRNNVTLRNLAVMRNRGAVQDNAFHAANLQNLTLDGVSIQWTAYTGLGAAYITGLTIRNSLLANNGVNALTGIMDNNVTFEDSEVSRNNWRGWPAEHKGFDSVLKWSESRDIVVRRSRFIDNWGHGLWFDGDNQRVLVENVFSARNGMRGLSLEYNGGPITIEDSKFCLNGLAGVSNARSNNTTLSYSQVFDNGSYQLIATGSPTPVTMRDTRTGASYVATGENWTITNNIIKGQPLAGGDPADNSCSPGPCGWVFWVATEQSDIYSAVANSLTSNYNQWYHTSTSRSFRVPDALGQAVDLARFRTLMGTVRPNDTNSSWGPPTVGLSCTP